MFDASDYPSTMDPFLEAFSNENIFTSTASPKPKSTLRPGVSLSAIAGKFPQRPRKLLASFQCCL